MHKLALLGLIPAAAAVWYDDNNAPIWTPSAGCPSAIKATIPRNNPHELPSGTYNFDVFAIHEALTHCPQIHSLDLRFALMGCSEWPPRWNLPFNQGGGEKYPPLTHLGLEKYSFDEREESGLSGLFTGFWDEQHPNESWFRWWWRNVPGWLVKTMKMKMLPTEQRNKTNLELWLDAMDFSKLESLALPNGVSQTFMEKATPRLSGLKRLSIGSSRNPDEVLRWIEQLPELTELKWIDGFKNSSDTLDTLLAKHGGTLKRLELRHQETLESRRPVFSAEQLRGIPRAAPNLKFLSVDVNQEGHWPFEKLEAILQNVELEQLEIWFEYASDLGREKRDDHYIPDEDGLLQVPKLEFSTAMGLNRWIREKTRGRVLREVTFVAGDWTRPWDGPLYFGDWMEGRQVKFTCDDLFCFPPKGTRLNNGPETLPWYPVSWETEGNDATSWFVQEPWDVDPSNGQDSMCGPFAQSHC